MSHDHPVPRKAGLAILVNVEHPTNNGGKGFDATIVYY